jgi:exopolysaccharide biosynthesis polyprenyl glycosylphosphotransferase
MSGSMKNVGRAERAYRNLMETLSSKSNLLMDPSISTKFHQASHTIPRATQWRLFYLSLIFSDAITIGIAFRAAYFVRFDLSFGFFNIDITPSFIYYQRLVVFLIPLWLGIFAIEGLYNRQKLLGGTEEYALIFNSTTIGMFMVISAGFLAPYFILARGWLILAWGFSFLITSIGRFILRRVVYLLRMRGYFLSNAVIIGANNEGISLAQQLMRWRTSGLQVLGFVDKKLPVGRVVLNNLYVLGNVDQLTDLIERYDIDELILASSAVSSRDKMMEIFQCFGTAKDINVRLSSGLYEIITTGLTVKEFAYVPLVGVNTVRLTGIDQFLKMVLDYCLTILVLILVTPLLILIGLAIKFDSPGPVVFRRRVLGVNGEEFEAYKFRTMHINGDEILSNHPKLQVELAENHKLKNDPRITRVGNFLRKSSLDELLQLFNVLKREMSLVGPRIITPEEVEKYNQWDINLLTIPPGITGLWQVSGRSDVSYEERVRLDMYYIRNWSIWLDLQILFQTIPAVLKGKGAY